LVALVGPTGVGKTAAAIELAARVGVEVVSADSRLLYRGMDIGTAKPTLGERRRVPHHLIDVAEPEQVWSLAEYREAALQVIHDIQRRGGLPLLVGGTGQYVTALLEGWAPPSGAVDHALRRELEAYAAQHGAAGLHRRLQQVDPERAAALDPRNVRRVVRALEIFQLTGQRPSQLLAKRGPGFRPLWLGLTLSRPELYRRIDRRIRGMLEGGLIEEVGRLLERGIAPDHPNMSAIGYRQVAEYLAGQKTLAEAEAEMRRLTRRFVRRQANWFKPEDPRIHWFVADQQVLERMEAKVKEWLAQPPGRRGLEAVGV
jgi:tRNA dimethylallyltransferase